MAAGSSAAAESIADLSITRIFDAPREFFDSTAARDSNQGGWNSALNCLAEYLATLR